jgi:hypothetical protein
MRYANHSEARHEDAAFIGAYGFTMDGITLPWDVPPNTIVIEYFDGRWRVVPHRGLSRSFDTREDAWAWARQIASAFPVPWTISEKPRSRRSVSAFTA